MAEESKVAKALASHWMTGFPGFDRTLNQQPGIPKYGEELAPFIEPKNPPGLLGGSTLFWLMPRIIQGLSKNQMGIPQDPHSIGESMFPDKTK